MLFFLVLLFQVLGYLLFEEEAVIAYCVKIALQLPRGYRAGIVHHLSNFVWYMLTGIIALMFLVWNLVYLAIAAAIIGISFIMLARTVSTPLYKGLEKWIRK